MRELQRDDELRGFCNGLGDLKPIDPRDAFFGQFGLRILGLRNSPVFVFQVGQICSDCLVSSNFSK